MGAMRGGERFEAGGDAGVDRALACEPSCDGGAVLAGTTGELPTGPSDGGQADGEAVGRHRVTILVTRASLNRERRATIIR